MFKLASTHAFNPTIVICVEYKELNPYSPALHFTTAHRHPLLDACCLALLPGKALHSDGHAVQGGLSGEAMGKRLIQAMLTAERSRAIVLMAQLQAKLSPVFSLNDEELWARIRQAVSIWNPGAVLVQYSVLTPLQIVVYTLKAGAAFPKVTSTCSEGDIVMVHNGRCTSGMELKFLA